MFARASDIDRLAPMRRPPGSPVGYQSWSELLFVHWRLAPSEVEPLLPKGVTLDTFDGAAWVGLVPFRMSKVRPWWSPPVPGLSRFLETNVRTYVHVDGANPGVWFFSLDASNSLAVRIARWKWQLNYFRARMRLGREGRRVRYYSERCWPGPPGASCAVDAETGDLTAALDKEYGPGRAVPGTLEHFLVERYFLYTLAPDGGLLRGQVHHAPYPLREARLIHCRETLLRAAGINLHAAPSHVVYSDGVDVEVFGLTSAEENR